ncbi:putative bifunctional diguanylate cyclase/phosphodiesterase [Sphingomonas azotifigens]|uniref:putative bifunctional diguanylate cyclase/phosphodiesterase n=1 Tax=Sphingomonas azotifigens TaxID=330920 RepID=UPI000A016211|nr:GGDEF and EAL domain-containing protein [Sphingomonas azotifigens]
MQNYREAARLDALHQLKLLDTPPSEHFDRITRMAAQIFGLPIAAVSLTDRDRQWFKSRVGVEHGSIPRDKAPCAEVAEEGHLVVIEDFATHPRYAESLLAEHGTRFYAGAPLVTKDGYGLGALCVLGVEPRLAAPEELAALTDLAAMVMEQIELQHAFGRIDPISGLPTRAQFRDDLADLALDCPGQARIAVIADLARDDQIAKIVGAMGAARLDEMVREASRAIQSALGADRTAYHVGTTQFAFLSPPDVDVAAYIAVIERGFEAIRATSSVRFVTSVAIGMRPFRLGEVPPEDVLRGAASAAQDARRNDGAIALYSADRDNEMRRHYDLLQDFGAALEAGDQLRLVYQPRVDLATGCCLGAETLLRWRHPELGEVSPAEFIPIIEQTALARPTTQWVLDTALDQLAAWQAAGLELTLSVNISAANLMEADLIQRLQLALITRQLRPAQLEIELTESAMMAEPEKALAMLRELAEAGIALAIDDFGTGHSSLAYLQQVPAQVVKIDQAFVRGLSAPWGADYVLVETMVDLIHKLGRSVVAEGVETEDAAKILAGMGCEEAQGYWFARPLEAAAFADWIAARTALAA